MPRIFDNIEQRLLPALRETLTRSERADFCVGYFNLRGWKLIDELIEQWAGGSGQCCRLLVGMQRLPKDDLQDALSPIHDDDGIDNAGAIRLKNKLAKEFRDQLMIGVPTDTDEAGLRRLSRQLRDKKVVVKLFLRHQLHAKLYLAFRNDPNSPTVAFLGSSNLTFSGLGNQGELNIDVLDHDACAKLARWFEERWDDKWCIDISKELQEIIDESWARETPLPPYHVYLKIAYHLSHEARAGLAEFKLPKDFEGKLFEFQAAAVKIAARHLHKRGGVLIGDVVGLGKTLMATAVARIFEDDHDLETLIICPKNLVEMWDGYRTAYRMRGRVLSVSRVTEELPKLRPYRVVLIDESHNLRNREGARYKAIAEYIRVCNSKVILLSATPYNKTYSDLSNQLRLFVPDDRDIGIRPEALLKVIGETEFIRRHQCGVRTLAGFDKSEFADDWRELMRLYLVRRTRGFIQQHYATTDETTGRKFLTFADGQRTYFPVRVPKTLAFPIDASDPNDQYAHLFAPKVVARVNRLKLPRYGLANYIHEDPKSPPTAAEGKVIADLSRAGHRLKGFCRTNLFKRLESSGFAFVQSVERHVLRNFVSLHALENGLPVPIGTQDADLLDTRVTDNEDALFSADDDGDDATPRHLLTEEQFRTRAAEVYDLYSKSYQKRFRWLTANRFLPQLATDLRADGKSLLKVLEACGEWNPATDGKLSRLVELLSATHANQKVLIFTQFADTVEYLVRELKTAGVNRVAGVTGATANPTRLVNRFSPVSNGKRADVSPDDELRVLVATDILSEGQNLQDAAVVVNFDLPWAIIRLIQRAGRVDRIGQLAETILCYTFLPADGVERVIQLRARVSQRLKENAEVVGTDEAFFEDETAIQALRDLFTEKAGVLDGDDDIEVDLGSRAWQIWKNATDADPRLAQVIPNLPDVIYSAQPHSPTPDQPEGVLAFVRTSEGTDALAWLGRDGKVVTESQFAILKAAECAPDTPAASKLPEHHSLVAQAVRMIATEDRTVGGQLGRPSGARFRTYERLKRYADGIKGTLFDTPQIRKVIEDIYNYPLKQAAADTLNRLLRAGIDDPDLLTRVQDLREDGRLSIIEEGDDSLEPKLICSLGLVKSTGGAK